MSDFDIKKVHLAKGWHHSREVGTCLMEAAAWMAGEVHSDHPKCVDPVLGAFGRAYNDRVNDAQRQEMIPLIPELLDTAQGSGLSIKRSYVLVDHAVRIALSEILRNHGYRREAFAFEQLDRIVDQQTVGKAHVLIGILQNEVISFGPHAKQDELRILLRSARTMTGLVSRDHSFLGYIDREGAAALAAVLSSKTATGVRALKCAIGQEL